MTIFFVGEIIRDDPFLCLLFLYLFAFAWLCFVVGVVIIVVIIFPLFLHQIIVFWNQNNFFQFRMKFALFNEIKTCFFSVRTTHSRVRLLIHEMMIENM